MIVKIMGGLGNQLFIYAFGYALIRERNLDGMVMDTENYDIYNGPSYMLDFFKIDYSKKLMKRNSILEKNPRLYKTVRLMKLKLKWVKVYKEKELFIKDNNIYLSNRNTLFIGYWQNFHYFDKYRMDILRQFTLKEKSKKVMRAIEDLDEHSIAVHVRRGDYKTYRGGKCLGRSYYTKVINECLDKDNLAVFYFFTDDVEYCKSAFGECTKEIVAEKYDFTDIEEFCFMSSFRRFVIANSTFSWWAAYLSEATDVYAPVVDMWKEEFYPKTWNKVQTEIEHCD